MRRMIGLMVLSAMACYSVASADVITFQNGQGGYSGNVDSAIRSESPDRNHGVADDIYAGWEASDSEFVGFSQWDFGSVPSGLTITSAKLGLYARDVQGTADRTITAYAMLSNITDMGDKYSATASDGEVTWANLAHNVTAWGGDSHNGPVAGTDYTTAYSSSLVIHDADQGGYVEWDVTDIVNAWYNGVLPNYGIMLRQASWVGSDTRTNLSSADTSNGNLPYLEITYTIVPEPGTIALALTGLVGLLAYAWRRRK